MQSTDAQALYRTLLSPKYASKHGNVVLRGIQTLTAQRLFFHPVTMHAAAQASKRCFSL
jgi:hypothetical protein